MNAITKREPVSPRWLECTERYGVYRLVHFDPLVKMVCFEAIAHFRHRAHSFDFVDQCSRFELHPGNVYVIRDGVTGNIISTKGGDDLWGDGKILPRAAWNEDGSTIWDRD